MPHMGHAMEPASCVENDGERTLLLEPDNEAGELISGRPEQPEACSSSSRPTRYSLSHSGHACLDMLVGGLRSSGEG